MTGSTGAVNPSNGFMLNSPVTCCTNGRQSVTIISTNRTVYRENFFIRSGNR